MIYMQSSELNKEDPQMNQKTQLYTFIFFILLIEKSSAVDPLYEACVPKSCRVNQNISYPFWIQDQQDPICGFPGFNVTCRNGQAILHIPENDYIVQDIFYKNNSLRVSNLAFSESKVLCFPEIGNFTFTGFQLDPGHRVSNLSLLSNCSGDLPNGLLEYRVDGCGGGAEDYWGLAMLNGSGDLGAGRKMCRKEVVAPVEMDGEDEIRNGGYLEVMKRGFVLNWRVTDCGVCASSGGRCGFNRTNLHFRCFCTDRPHALRCYPEGKKKRVILISVFSGVGGAILCCLLFIYWRRRKLGIKAYMLSRNTSSDPSSRDDPEVGGSNVYFGVPVFTYKELEEATANFDSSKELGDGGFGTVYYGKLKDGREVAVKKLYENNYKRVQQFMNEIEILTRLRHRNLVTLYGCTSRHSRELLLVYEYISNGTVADHLHKNGAEPGSSSLPLPIRLNIAIETASALSYLHASEIVHRDVKTNNILLDSNFCVKVADFGLSRLFPSDVTHVSTAPQGTPGYVDPEYHQCYQLTNKSDVYSFGVVLIELISSMPAVDITRHKHEINLANLAINRIQKCAFSELVDSSIGFESDESVKRMTIAVAELAFLCLQQENEMRPTMDEVLKTLKEIVGETDDGTELSSISRVDGSDSIELSLSSQPPPSPESDDAVLLKNKNLVTTSPEITPTHQWNRNASGKF